MKKLNEREKERVKKLLKTIKSENILVLVEGKKDEKVLKKLGITKIMRIDGRSVVSLENVIKRGKVLILTDFDKEGRRKASKLCKLFERIKEVKIYKRLRYEFRKLFKISKIEEIDL